ncbi:10720_t:CDS:2, partial [Cetraspora pellucida]
QRKSMFPTKRASSKYSDWFEKALRDGIITLYKYSLYSNVKEVGKGGFGIVYSADYKGTKVALKSVNTNEVTKEFVIEHPKNVLINDGKFLIADFGLSRKENDSVISSISTSHGAPAYIDPQYFMQVGKKRDEKSDIYSLGVIFWELTSGTASFGSFDNKYAICCQISQGLREETIAGTPSKFSELYKKCWNIDPQRRPTPSEILTTLDKISKETSVEFIINTNQRPVPISTNNSSQIFREPSSESALKKSLSRSIINFTRPSQKMLQLFTFTSSDHHFTVRPAYFLFEAYYYANNNDKGNYNRTNNNSQLTIITSGRVGGPASLVMLPIHTYHGKNCYDLISISINSVLKSTAKETNLNFNYTEFENRKFDINDY